MSQVKRISSIAFVIVATVSIDLSPQNAVASAQDCRLIPATGALSACLIPAGVTQYAVELAGGQGGTGANVTGTHDSTTGVGGTGAIVVANVTKQSAAQTIFVAGGEVGLNGASQSSRAAIPGGASAQGSQGGASWGGRPDIGAQGGSGGGASEIRTTQLDSSSRFLVAGGGGGGGADGGKRGGHGGNASANGTSGSTSALTFSSSSTLGNGANGLICEDIFMDNSGSGGGGGAGLSNTSGGGGGTGCANGLNPGAGGAAGHDGQDLSGGGLNWYGGRAGVLGVGGAAGQGTWDVSGGGGGGGYFGGGAGGNAGGDGFSGGGGGGGGSSYIGTSAQEVYISNTNTNEGYVRISTIISELPPSQYTAGENFSYLVETLGFEKGKNGTALQKTFELENAPAGISINATSGEISGTTYAVGSYSMTVTVSATWLSPDRVISSRQVIPFEVTQGQIIKKDQTSNVNVPLSMKKNSSKTFTVANLKTSAGQEIVLSTLGKCSVKATYKYVKTKVGKKTKKVKTLAGYKVTMGKKAKKTCTLTQYAKPTDSYNEFSSSSNITIR